MRKLKKFLAVATTAVMTMAMGITAFAGTEITFHFKNAANWTTVGAWCKQGIDWKGDVLPADKCIMNGEKPLWPGAKMESEGNGWYKVTCNYDDPSQGAMMIFNNYVADNKITDTTTQEDLDKLAASGVTCDTSAKTQTPNIMFQKGKLTGTEYWINWDGNVKGTMMVFGKSDMITDAAPADYSAGGSGDNGSNAGSGDGTTVNNDGSNASADGSADGTADGTAAGSATSGNKTNKKAPTTGDSVAMTVVLFGIVSAVAFVAAKKKVNA